MAILTRRFRKFYKKTSEQRKFKNFKNQKEKKESITCYECKKLGHIRSKYPRLNKLKKKALVATWDDSNEETSDDDEHQEMTNLALMAIGKESLDELDEVYDLPTYDELHDAFKELHDECMKIGKKNACIKKKMLEHTNEKDALEKCNDSLNEKIKKLELENKILHDKIASFKGKQSTSYEHEKAHVDELVKENKYLRRRKKS